MADPDNAEVVCSIQTSLTINLPLGLLTGHKRSISRTSSRDPDSFRAKEQSKLGVLEGIMQPELYPELYGDIEHQVSINYYPPRGDNREGWDNIDIFGWLGYPMQIKVNLLCRDSILAETFTIGRLGVPPTSARTLRSTNTIESRI